MNILEIEKTVKNFLDLTFIGFSFKLPIPIENDFYIIGFDYEDKVGINSKNNFVYSLSDTTLFINSSLNQFIDCLLFFKETFSFEEEYSDVLRLKKMKIIREHFIEIDKQCFSENTWWSYILEQVEDGIL
ncbi:immunity protein [Capnocytophaga sputigena]|uniref:immunity protein n=1 Tax=Capnocytophaga sputigena TaxID=1019 RepID=UPI0028D7BFB6|nr:immunity protein [Capnocytophaga sputigena]